MRRKSRRRLRKRLLSRPKLRPNALKPKNRNDLKKKSVCAKSKKPERQEKLKSKL